MGKVFRGYWEEKLPDGRRTMHRPGDAANLTQAVLDRLFGVGIVVDASTPKATKPAPAPEPVQEEEPKQSAAPERPWKTAKLDAWQEYARSQGVDPSGLSKQELIAKLG